jgi:hypothetical protein
MRLAGKILGGCLLFIFLLVCLVGCGDNSQFTLQISGPSGMEFSGFCTYEMKELTGSVTKSIDFEGQINDTQPFLEYVMSGTETSCFIYNSEPYTPITLVLFKDGQEVNRVRTNSSELNYNIYIDYYPPQK